MKQRQNNGTEKEAWWQRADVCIHTPALRYEYSNAAHVSVLVVYSVLGGSAVLSHYTIMNHSKHWIPLARNPDLFTRLTHQLGPPISSSKMSSHLT